MERHAQALVEVKYAAHAPRRYSSDAAGHDCFAAEDVLLPVGVPTLVSCGFRIAIPPGYVGLMCPRSGLALKSGVFVLNAPGIIDSDYRGVVKAILMNMGKDVYPVKEQERIAQLVIVPYNDMPLYFGTLQGSTERGEGGFGSTGQ